MLRLHIESGQDYDDDSDRRRRAARAFVARRGIHADGSGGNVAQHLGPVHRCQVENTRGEVNVETVQGEVIVRGGSGNISVESVQGSVTVEAARGRVNAHSVSESIVLRDIVGDISAEAVSGDITLEKIRATNVEATTVSGELIVRRHDRGWRTIQLCQSQWRRDVLRSRRARTPQYRCPRSAVTFRRASRYG